MINLGFMKEFLKEAKELGEPLYLTKEKIYIKDMEKFKEQKKLKKQNIKTNIPKENNKNS